MQELELTVIDQHIRILCNNRIDYSNLATNFVAFIRSGEPGIKPLLYQIQLMPDGQRIIETPEKTNEVILDNSGLIYYIEKDITIELQKKRNDLFFIHAATLKLGNRAFLIIGKSGAGKSTTTWALTHHGFSYLTDELSPLDLTTMQVWPYPHAICLKATPPSPYSLPEQTLKTERTMHIPTEYLAGGVTTEPTKIEHIFFIEYNSKQNDVLLKPISAGDATIRLYTNALNQLAHEKDGLPAAAQIASSCQSYELSFNKVYQACLKIRNLLQH